MNAEKDSGLRKRKRHLRVVFSFHDDSPNNNSKGGGDWCLWAFSLFLRILYPASFKDDTSKYLFLQTPSSHASRFLSGAVE